MNILTVVDTIKELSQQKSVDIGLKLSCEWHRGVEYGGISDHTTLTSLQFKSQWRRDYHLTVGLTHKCPIGAFRDKVIRKAPYYCKQCAQCIISAEQGPGFALPVDSKIVPKMQISIASLAYRRDPNTDFDIGNMVLTKYDGWVHKCPAVTAPNRIEYTYTKQTLAKLPFKCKLCKQHICEEGMTFKKLVALASIMRNNK